MAIVFIQKETEGLRETVLMTIRRPTLCLELFDVINYDARG